MSDKKNKRGAHLADLKKREAEQTAERLMKALDRFEHGGLENLKEGSKLTRLNLAAEAGVARETPFSRYRQDHPNAGACRFPKVVERFERLRAKGKRTPRPDDPDEVAQLKAANVELQNALSTSRIVANALDAQNVDLRRRNAELEELVSRISEERDHLNSEIIKLKRQSISEVPAAFSKRR
jgi:hypothetical protein